MTAQDEPPITPASSGSRDGLSRFFTMYRGGQAVLAVAVGILTGLVCVLFHGLIVGWSRIMSGFPDYAAVYGHVHGTLGWGTWFLLFTPVISALIYGPVVHKWAPSTGGIGIPEVMLAVRRKGGRITKRIMFIKVFAAALTMGGGGSVGKEGPVVQAGAAVGSWVGTRLHLPTRQLIILVTCGSAGGVAATFNAPLAAAVFALEVIIVRFNAEVFSMAVLSSVSSAVVARAILGDAFMITLPRDLELSSSIDLWAVALIGVLAGLMGVLLSKTLYAMTDLFDAIHRGPEWTRPVIFSFGLGFGLWMFPMMYGTSTSLQTHALMGRYTVGFLLMLAFLKVIFTSYTISMGGSGGIFAPSLFIGATTGAAIGQLLDPLTNSDPGVFGVIGMGAAFAGAARAPMAAVIIILEMTGQFSLILPLMLAIVIATAVSRSLTRKTIYTEKLMRRGDNLDDPVNATLLGRNAAKTLMGPVPGTIAHTASIAHAASIMTSAEATILPVLDENDKFVGCVSSLEIASAQLQDEIPESVMDLHLTKTSIPATAFPSVFMQRILANHVAGLPVLEEGKVIGWIAAEDLVNRMYRQQRRALEARESESSLGSRWLDRQRKKHTPDEH
ncbi:MAG: chloride channel protein [Actinomycetaceae bacterium]|nr:chloride channel protein [Actinomycetaceae bacterium]